MTKVQSWFHDGCQVTLVELLVPTDFVTQDCQISRFRI